MVEEGRMLDDLDKIDFEIIRMLQDDGRVPNTRIARELGVSEPTVRKRIERLLRDDIIRVTAILNPRRTGYACDVILGLRTEPGRMVEVGDQLAGLDQVVYLGYITGRYDILVEILFRDDSELFAFLEQEIGRIDGIVSTETFHVLRADRIDWDWRPLPADPAPGARLGARTRVRAARRASPGAPPAGGTSE